MHLFPVTLYLNKCIYLDSLTLRSSFRQINCICCVQPQPLFIWYWLKSSFCMFGLIDVIVEVHAIGFLNIC